MRTLRNFLVSLACCTAIALPANAQGRLQDVDVAIETRFVTLSENFYERIGIDFGGFYALPGSGLMRRHFDNGFGGRLAGTINLLDSVGGNPNWKVAGVIGYTYTRLDGNDEYQFNGPAQNVRLDFADTHVADLGLQLRRTFGNLTLAAGVSYNLGYIQAETYNAPFNPVGNTIFLQDNIDTSGFLHGYRARFQADWRVNDRLSVGAYYNIGHDFTSVLENRSQGSLMHEFGGVLKLTLGRRDPYTRQRVITLFTPRIIDR